MPDGLYSVTIKKISVRTILVQASSSEEAEEKSLGLIGDVDSSDSFEFYTKDISDE